MSDFKVDIDLDAVEAASVRGHALDFPHTAISNAIDAFVTGLAAVFNWVWLLLIVLIVTNVAAPLRHRHQLHRHGGAAVAYLCRRLPARPRLCR